MGGLARTKQNLVTEWCTS